MTAMRGAKKCVRLYMHVYIATDCTSRMFRVNPSIYYILDLQSKCLRQTFGI